MSDQSKTILVTGGAGFIGSNFIEYLLKKYPYYRVVCADKLTYAGNKETLRRNGALGSANFAFFEADICDRSDMDRIIGDERPDVVVNFAAESHVERSIRNPNVFLYTNVIGTQVLMDTCLAHGVGKFHQISTDEVYGGTSVESKIVFTEDSPLLPSTPYSASKASADLLVMAYINTFGIQATISRCSNNYGPYQHIEKLIPLTIQRLRQGKKLTVHGCGSHIRDWIHVYDHCAAVDRILQDGTVGKIYNITGENPRSSIEVMGMICNKLGVDLAEKAEYVADRPGNDMRYAMSPCTMQTQFGWYPRMDFETELKNTIDWYLENQDWVESFNK